MRSLLIKVGIELAKLRFQIGCIPEEELVYVFSPDGADEAFDEWMRERYIRHGLDFVDVQDTEIGLPPRETEERIVVGGLVAGVPIIAAITSKDDGS